MTRVHLINGESVAFTAEEEAAQDAIDAAWAAGQAARDTMALINTLEGSVTPRRMREAALNLDGGWLESVNNQITVLRGQL